MEIDATRKLHRFKPYRTVSCKKKRGKIDFQNLKKNVKLFFEVLSLSQLFLGLPSYLYIELAMENPNLQSKPCNFAV